jgi:CDP-glucose 4,6-dehydratase
VDFVSDWYYKYYRESADMYALTQTQIGAYEERARQRGLVWTR